VIIGASGGGSGFIFIILIGFLLIYLLFVRPQKRRQTQQQQLIDELRVGDEVLTAGGIYGTISRLEDDQVTVEIAPEIEVRVARRAIAGVTSEPEEDEPDADEPEEPETEPDEPQDEVAEGAPSTEEHGG
jgi:preprotein translocase subunit YajC